MSNILQEIAERTRERVEAQKKILPQEKLTATIEAAESGFAKLPYAFPFEEALAGRGVSLICEIKKASPSKGVIAPHFPYMEIARDYEAAGAAAISVLTEPFWFKGHDEYLKEISAEAKIPLLRKDFTVDKYMVYEAKLLGADAVLLICAILAQDTLTEYIKIAHSIGLSALVEAHDENEIKMAVAAGARVIGVNNRDLRTFEVDITLSERLKKFVPDDVLFVSESGISTAEDVQRLRDIGAHGALVGESLMRSADKKASLQKLKGGA
ncbi:MAG: indole-3-glycerol phosphate synthase TrpC [Defluviitaleaceae bacterium]|nr:indole-3-glycerol phosphate synthase TrpC [Defluviitaleaceae bacterium]